MLAPTRLAAALVVLLTAAPALAQAPEPPGPYVFDLRGATMAVPVDPSFHPPHPAGTLLPSRGFGLDAGGHVYLFRVAGGQLGIGASLLRIYASSSAPESPEPAPGTPPVPRTIPDVRTTMTVLAPQLSLNFGTRNGWSYVSGGLGAASVRTATQGLQDAAEQESGRLRSLNVGGGARWFRSPRLAFGFDVRVHIVAAGSQPLPEATTPKVVLMAASVGISLR